MTQRSFEFKFNDHPSKNGITFDYDKDNEIEEELAIATEHGTTVIYANRQAYLVLAKAFIKMALCDYPDGFPFSSQPRLRRRSARSVALPHRWLTQVD